MPAHRKRFLQLRHKIEDAGYTNSEFAAAFGHGCSWISGKLSGNVPWTVPEALKAMALLGIPGEELVHYFRDAAPEESQAIHVA